MLGATQDSVTALVAKALKEPSWFGLAKLDASVCLVNSIVEAEGIKVGEQAVKLVETFYKQVSHEVIFKIIPHPYWSVMPQDFEANTEEILILSGAVLLQV